MHKVHTSAGHSHRRACADDTAIDLCSGGTVRPRALDTSDQFPNKERPELQTFVAPQVIKIPVNKPVNVDFCSNISAIKIHFLIFCLT